MSMLFATSGMWIHTLQMVFVLVADFDYTQHLGCGGQLLQFPMMSLASAMRCSAQHQKQLYETERNKVSALLLGQAAGQGAWYEFRGVDKSPNQLYNERAVEGGVIQRKWKGSERVGYERVESTVVQKWERKIWEWWERKERQESWDLGRYTRALFTKAQLLKPKCWENAIKWNAKREPKSQYTGESIDWVAKYHTSSFILKKNKQAQNGAKRPTK